VSVQYDDKFSPKSASESHLRISQKTAVFVRMFRDMQH